MTRRIQILWKSSLQYELTVRKKYLFCRIHYDTVTHTHWMEKGTADRQTFLGLRRHKLLFILSVAAWPNG